MADPTRMEEYYKILHHLKGFKVDRQYPYSFESTDNVKPSEKVESIAVEDMSHANLLRFTSLTNSDVIIIPTIQRDYFSIDSVEIKVSPLDGDLDPSKVELEFHDTLQGDVALLSLPGSGETIAEDSVGAVTFVINDQSMDPKSSVLAGVQSLSIHLNQSITGIELSMLYSGVTVVFARLKTWRKAYLLVRITSLTVLRLKQSLNLCLNISTWQQLLWFGLVNGSMKAML